MERDIILIVTGGLIGLVSSLATIFAIYLLDGLRLKRQWQREDQLLLGEKRREIDEIMALAEQAQAPESEISR